MTKSQIKDFTSGPVTVPLIKFATPLFLSNLLQVFYNMVDMIVVGKVNGSIGTSAVAVGGDISNLLTFIAIGFANAGQVLIARHIGAGEKHKLSKFIGTISGFLAVCAVIMSVVGILLQEQLLRLMNTPEASYVGAAQYSIICMSGMVFIYGYNIVSAILRGMGDSKHPFMFIAIAAVVNLVLDIVFVVIIPLGPAGAAIATVVGQATSFITSLIFLSKRREQFELNITKRDFIRWDREMLAELCKLGTPIAIKSCSVQVSKLFVNSFINSYGIAVSAFAGIANQISSTANLISTAVNTAGSTMVGQNLAAEKYERLKKILLNLTVIMMSVAMLLSVLFCVFPNEIIGLFAKDNDPEVMALIPGFLPIAVILFFGASARAVMNALLNGSGNSKINFVTAILDGIVLRIGLSILFGITLGMGCYGFWLGDALAGFTPFFIGIVFYLSGKWRISKKKSV